MTRLVAALAVLIGLSAGPAEAQSRAPTGGGPGEWTRLLGGQWRQGDNQACNRFRVELTTSNGFLFVTSIHPLMPSRLTAKINAVTGTVIETTVEGVVNSSEPQQGDRMRFEFFSDHWDALNLRTGERERHDRC